MHKGRSPTIKDVARAAGVSSATVSYVLNGLNKVSPEVDETVRKAAAELGYTRNNAARALKTGRNNIIGCLLPTLTSPVFPEIAKAVQRRAEQLGFATVVIDAGEEPLNEQRVIQQLISHGVDGAVALLNPAFDRVGIEHFPMVALDAPVEGLDCVMADHFAGGRLMAEAIIAQGHQRVGMLSGDLALYSSRLRHDGFVEAAKGKLEIVWDVTVDLLPQLNAEAVAALAEKRVTAVACANDLVAIGALSALKGLGLRVPEDVAVIGFDDMQMSAWPLIDLATVRQPLEQLGFEAVDLLVRRLTSPDEERVEKLLPVAWVGRGTMR